MTELSRAWPVAGVQLGVFVRATIVGAKIADDLPVELEVVVHLLLRERVSVLADVARVAHNSFAPHTYLNQFFVDLPEVAGCT